MDKEEQEVPGEEDVPLPPNVDRVEETQGTAEEVIESTTEEIPGEITTEEIPGEIIIEEVPVLDENGEPVLGEDGTPLVETIEKQGPPTIVEHVGESTIIERVTKAVTTTVIQPGTIYVYDEEGFWRVVFSKEEGKTEGEDKANLSAEEIAKRAELLTPFQTVAEAIRKA